jgi:hypothetical protein
MMAIRVKPFHFSGAGKVHGRDADALGAIVRGLAIDHARAKAASATIADLTDNTTGVAAASVVDLVLPTAAFDASSAGGATRTDFNTAIGKFENAGAVLGDNLNKLRARLGLELVSWASGTIAAAATLPAQDKSVNTTSGATALNYASGRTAMAAAKANLRKLVRAFNECMVALGFPKVTDALSGPFGDGYILVAIADADADDQTGTANDGKTAISKTVADTFLDSLADNLATLAAFWNVRMGQAGLTDLTDNSGGSAAGDTIAEIDQSFTAHQDGTDDSAPATQFNTELAKIENNFADLALRINTLAVFHGLGTLLADSTGGTANTTIEVIDDTLTAVGGTSDTTLSKASADVTFGQIADNFATLVEAVNELCPLHGLTELDDGSGGEASASGTLVALTDGVGVDNSAAATGTANAEVNAALDGVTDNLATIAAKLNAMTGSGLEIEAHPLHVVAVE